VPSQLYQPKKGHHCSPIVDEACTLTVHRQGQHQNPLTSPLGGEYAHSVQPGARGYGVLIDDEIASYPLFASQLKGYDGLFTGDEARVTPLP